MTIENNISLKSFNTFGVEARASLFRSVTAPEELAETLANARGKYSPLVLGSGSNILFTKHFEGLVLKNDIKGLAVLDSDDQTVRIRAGGGEDWHVFVQWCLQHHFFGLENLALIPGTVGAAPVQNIGAYGVEVGDYVEAVEAVDIQSGVSCHFKASACGFAYRDSIFKGRCWNRYFITAVIFRLHRHARLNTSYADVRRALRDRDDGALTPQELFQIICEIRRRKLPDPRELPNAGSFFKNPVIARDRYNALADRFPDLPAYPVDDRHVKIAAGWMIEHCGWKGRRLGACGVYPRQALVMVNYGGATGMDILHLAEAVQASVDKVFDIRLQPEPLIL